MATNCSLNGNYTANCESSTSFVCPYDPFVLLHVPKNLYYTYFVTAALNVVFAATSFCGNSLVLIALLRTPSLHSPSKALLRSLALSDLFVGLFVQPMYIAYCLSGISENHWVRCISWFIYPLLMDYFVAVSFLTMVAISIDRYLALRLRASYRSVVTIKKVNITVVSIWITSLVFPITRVIAGKLTLLLSCTFFALFVVIPTFTHCTIHRTLQRRGRQVTNQFFLHRKESHLSIHQYKKSVSAMRYLYIALLISYTPITCVSLLYIKQDPSMATILLPAGNVATTLLFFNSSLNPVLYCWRIRQVRGAMLNLADSFICC